MGIRTESEAWAAVVADVSNDDPVDFSWMTDSAVHPGKNGGWFSWFTKVLWARRPDGGDKDIREDIVPGHVCAKGQLGEVKGARRSQTYYGSSFCYYYPDIHPESSDQSGLGFVFTGNMRNKTTTEFCRGMTGAGKCMKCSVCHNNLISQDRTLEFTEFVEEIVLPGGCLKETEIEKKLYAEFDATNATLATEFARCWPLKLSVWDAYNEWDAHENRTATLKEDIEGVESQIRLKTEEEESVNEKIKNLDDGEIKDKRNLGYDKCRPYAQTLLYTQRQWLDLMFDTTRYSLKLVLSEMTFRCSTNCRLSNGAQPDNCCMCDAVRDDLQELQRRREVLEGDLVQLSTEKRDLQRQIEELEKAKAEELSKRGAYEAAKLEADTTWLPHAAVCEPVLEEYKEKSNKYIIDNTLRFWDDSCEKACMTMQVSYGCGVMEGSRPPSGTQDLDAQLHNGDIHNTCRPPLPSWIHGAYNRGAQPEETSTHCRRILENQSPKHAQRIEKVGMMHMKRRFFTYKTRFFAFESGDQVRSAKLRIWWGDPQQADTWEQKSIILWDAKAVARSGKNCVFIRHFYRHYTLCDPAGPESRDEWFELIKAAIIYPNA
jgi:hypothetical protein